VELNRLFYSKSKTSIFSAFAFGRYIFGTLENKANCRIIYPLSPLLTPKYVTLNDPEWLFYVRLNSVFFAQVRLKFLAWIWKTIAWN